MPSIIALTLRQQIRQDPSRRSAQRASQASTRSDFAYIPGVLGLYTTPLTWRIGPSPCPVRAGSRERRCAQDDLSTPSADPDMNRYPRVDNSSRVSSGISPATANITGPCSAKAHRLLAWKKKGGQEYKYTLSSRGFHGRLPSSPQTSQCLLEFGRSPLQYCCCR